MTEFEKLCWDIFKDSDDVDRLMHQLKEIHKNMMKHKPFANADLKTQLEMCTTIGCMVIHTTTADLREMHILRKKDRGNLEFDIMKNYKEPNRIHITQIKRLPKPIKK